MLHRAPPEEEVRVVGEQQLYVGLVDDQHVGRVVGHQVVLVRDGRVHHLHVAVDGARVQEVLGLGGRGAVHQHRSAPDDVHPAPDVAALGDEVACGSLARKRVTGQWKARSAIRMGFNEVQEARSSESRCSAVFLVAQLNLLHIAYKRNDTVSYILYFIIYIYLYQILYYI